MLTLCPALAAREYPLSLCSTGRRTLQLARDFAEGAAEIGADYSHHPDGSDRDEGGNQSIFDCGNTRFVVDQLGKEGAHRIFNRLYNA